MPNYCSQVLAGLGRDCNTNMGGLKRVLIAPAEDVTAVTVGTDDGNVSTITMTTGKQFFEYLFKPGTATQTSTLNKDDTVGMNYVSSEIVLFFHRMDTQKRKEMNALALGDMVVITEDMNGKYWFFGKDEPVTASAGDGQTGAARSDANRYSITLKDNSADFPYEVDATIIDALLVPAT